MPTGAARISGQGCRTPSRVSAPGIVVVAGIRDVTRGARLPRQRHPIDIWDKRPGLLFSALYL